MSSAMHVSFSVKVRLKVEMYRECEGNNGQQMCLECKVGGFWKGVNQEGYVRVLQNTSLKSGLHFKATLVTIGSQCLACERRSINVVE